MFLPIILLLHLKKKPLDISPWKQFVQKTKKARSEGKEVHIAVVGKYFDTGDFVLSDAYVSVIEALKFSSYSLGVKPVLHWINSKQFEVDSSVDKKTGKRIEKPLTREEVQKRLKTTFGGGLVDEHSKLDSKGSPVPIKIDGILVPGGFGESGIEGKISVIEYAREQKIPYFGICYGMQLMVIEYARHKAGITDATTAEVQPNSPSAVIQIMDHQKKMLEEGKFGASMRLGGYPCVLNPKTVAGTAYAKAKWTMVHGQKHPSGRAVKDGLTFNIPKQTPYIIERHRHRYEVNPEYVVTLTDAGLIFSGTSPDGHLMEIAELGVSTHPFFVGVQFHPEFLARPLDPHPLFSAFVSSCAQRLTS
jgi:CTP synthase